MGTFLPNLPIAGSLVYDRDADIVSPLRRSSMKSVRPA